MTPQDERAAVVAWLRANASAGDERLLEAIGKYGIHDRRSGGWAGGVIAIHRAADAIERGDHITPGGG